jgi:hypothetical protein
MSVASGERLLPVGSVDTTRIWSCCLDYGELPLTRGFAFSFCLVKAERSMFAKDVSESSPCLFLRKSSDPWSGDPVYWAIPEPRVSTGEACLLSASGDYIRISGEFKLLTSLGAWPPLIVGDLLMFSFRLSVRG